MIRHNSGLRFIARTGYDKNETDIMLKAAMSDVCLAVDERKSFPESGLYVDKYQILGRLDAKLEQLKKTFSHNELERFAAEVVYCLASVNASYRCGICRDTLIADEGEPCECTQEDWGK